MTVIGSPPVHHSPTARRGEGVGKRSRSIGAIQDNAEGASGIDAVVSKVRPEAVSRGGRRTVSIVLDPRKAGRGPVPPEQPTWVQIGPYEAVAIARAGNAVTVEIDVPDDATLGVPLDCHLEFDAGGRTRAFKKNGVMRVVE